MMKGAWVKIKKISKLNLIWAGFGFGILYWIFESVRDVLVFDNGTLIARVFKPDSMSLWMRILVVCIIVLYSVSIESLRERQRKDRHTKSKMKGKFGIILASLAFGGLYWILVSVQDVFLVQNGNIIQHILSPDPMRFWMKLLAVCFFFLLSIYAHNLIDERCKAEEALQKAHDELERLVEEKSAELTESNTLLQQEISESKRLDKALQLSKKSFHNIVDVIGDGIIVLDSKGVVCFVNSAAEHLFGRESNAFVGESFDVPLEEGEVSELNIMCDDGKTNVVEVRVVKSEWEGEPACLASCRNITERKQMEEELKQANEKLRRIDRMKSDFLSVVSHELRTPIAIMRQGVSLCLAGDAGDLTDTQREFLSITSENIERLARLVTDLLDISKIEAGKIKLRRASLDMCEVIKKIKISFQPNANEKGVHLILEIPEDSLTFFGDEDKLTQIFNNLISNALRYTKSGGRIVIKASEENDFIHCSVADTGVGIAKKDIPKLFSKFEQFGRVEGSGYKGTGLGLAIAKGLIEKQGGKIWIESELGKGTTFFFTLEKVPPPKILIVDDEPGVVNVVKQFLKGNGYQFLEANDGSTAIEMARTNEPSLVVLDLALPDMNGYQVIERLKQHEQTSDIPVLLLSGYAVDEERLEQIDSRTSFPFIPKPIKLDVLCNNVKEILNN